MPFALRAQLFSPFYFFCQSGAIGNARWSGRIWDSIPVPRATGVKRTRELFRSLFFFPREKILALVEGVYTQQETGTWLMICMLLMMWIYSEPCAANSGTQRCPRALRTALMSFKTQKTNGIFLSLLVYNVAHLWWNTVQSVNRV